MNPATSTGWRRAAMARRDASPAAEYPEGDHWSAVQQSPLIIYADADQRNAKFPKVVSRQLAQHFGVDGIFPERILVAPSPRPRSQSAISMTSSDSRQLGKEHCGVLQIGGTEALGEPAIHGREQVVRLGPPALFAPQPSKARCRAQLGVAKINEYAVAHVLGDKSSEAGDRVGHAAMIGTDNLAQILGVVTRRQWRRATRSQNITVSCRR